MRKADVKRLAASYGLYIDEKGLVRQACETENCIRLYGSLFVRLETCLRGADGHWDLVPASATFDDKFGYVWSRWSWSAESKYR